MTDPYELDGEWYGAAPCGCWRMPRQPDLVSDSTFAAALCMSHSLTLGQGPWMSPWAAASAIQRGLRAIAEWEKPKNWAFLKYKRKEAEFLKRNAEEIARREAAAFSGYREALNRRIWDNTGGQDSPVRSRCYYCGVTVPCAEHEVQP